MGSTFWDNFSPSGATRLARRKEKGAAINATALRRKTALDYAGRSQELRDRWKRLYKPMEEGLSAEVIAGYEPDYATISSDAIGGVGDSFSRSTSGYRRNAARLGIDPGVADSQEVQRLRGLDSAAAKVFVANNAVSTARDRAEQLTANRGAQITQLGASRPYLSSYEQLAGDSAMADLADYELEQRTRAVEDIASAQQAGVNSSTYAHGGAVKKPMRYGIGKPYINGTAKRVYADGGEVARPRREMGGAVGETARLSNMHREEYGAGKTDKQFGEWLEENGYELGGDNMARPKALIRTSSNQNVDDRPRTPDFLFKPLKKAPKHYADGGLIEDVPVDLETNDYIMPADVVSKLGREYFDDLVAGAEEEPKPHYASGGLVGGIRPGQGAANFIGGFQQGLNDYRQEKAFDEDRAYLREERAYQKSQRAKAELKAAYEQDIDAATAQFARSGGVNLAPIIGVGKKYNMEDGDISVVPNPDGTFLVTEIGKDGNPASAPQKMSRDDIRSVGMNVIESMRDPKALIKSWNEKPTTVNTPYGSVTNAYDPRTRKWSPIADNNSDARATQGSGRGGRGADVLGWKDHNQMNDDIQRLAFRRFSVPSPNGVGSILDPDGQQKAGMFKNFVFAELDKLGKSPRDLTSSELNAAAGLAETSVEEQFLRRGAKRIKGAGKGILNLFDPDKAAADMVTYFPSGGSEPEMRTFMAQRDITDKADQDQVLAKMQTYQGGPRGGLGAGPAAKPAPVQKPGQRTAVDVKAEYKAGRISREQAVQELKAMGFQ